MFQCSDHPANIRLVKAFSRHLGQDEYTPFRITSSKEVLVKTLVLAIPVKYIFKTSSRRFQDVSKMSCQNVFKTSSRRFAKGPSRCLAKLSSRYLQDVFETSCKDVFKTFSRIIKHVSFPMNVIYRAICLDNTTCEKFMVSVQNLQER